MESSQRPAFRRSNQHLFERAYFNLSSMQRSSIPLPSPFDCVLPEYPYVPRRRVSGPQTSDTTLNPESSPRQEENAGREAQGEVPISGLQLAPEIALMQLQAPNISLALRLPARPRKLPTIQENPVPELTELSPMKSVTTQMNFGPRGSSYSFSSSNVCVEHVEDVEDYFNFQDAAARRPFVIGRLSTACFEGKDRSPLDSGYASLLSASSSSGVVGEVDLPKDRIW